MINNSKNYLLYNINEKPKKLTEWILFAMQQVLAVICATLLIAVICGTPASGALFGACCGTLLYQAITKFRSPVFISSSGATVSAVIGALSLNAAGNNYLMVFFGGLIVFAIYAIFSLVVKKLGVEAINKIFPPAIVGAVTIVIGINLAAFIGSYTMVNGAHSNLGVIIAIVTMIVAAVVSQYGKGFLKNIPFVIAIAAGYLAALAFGLVDFTPFKHLQWYPDLTFLQWRASDFSFANLGATALFFIPVSICALLEHYSDHKVLSNIIGTDLTVDPGLDRTLLGDGAASALGTALCGLPNTTFGESIATIGFSRVASVWVTTAAAITMGVLSFFAPIGAFVQTIPACVFGGVAMILYGYIIASGLKTLYNAKTDLENTKNIVIISVILTVGTSGIWLFNEAFAGVSLAMVLGVLLNFILVDKKKAKKEN